MAVNGQPLSKRETGGPDRDERGRFLKGHSVKSPGNPNIVALASHRAAVVVAISPADLVVVLRKALELAKNGDLAAIKFVVERVLGLPPREPQPPDPWGDDPPDEYFL